MGQRRAANICVKRWEADDWSDGLQSTVELDGEHQGALIYADALNPDRKNDPSQNCSQWIPSILY